jgi:2'-5' RNA ligase
VRCGDEIRQRDQLWADQKWVQRQNLHITIAFLGDVERALIPAVSEIMRECASEVGALVLRFTALEAMPRTSRASMLWVRAADDGTTGRIAEALGAAFVSCSIPRDERPFTPHVTLVRARRPVRAPSFLEETYAASSLDSISVSDPPITLFSSRLTKTGPIYETLATVSIEGVQ